MCDIGLYVIVYLLRYVLIIFGLILIVLNILSLYTSTTELIIFGMMGMFFKCVCMVFGFFIFVIVVFVL